ncbi:hypothetical protein BTO32_03025 [Marinobacter lutaoensis]|uniref:PA14 domain-containing protein n=1 Tax=Marinobacter lutaoensis TaxID=135739 RepID=A0A1V2DYS0_9GAMM|nr:PA14 domain-containing protein [Marinobacter lutaoensis]ONF45441.1 hypothetical protein BTO32_03025 [Marinobacter lutaoensis]
MSVLKASGFVFLIAVVSGCQSFRYTDPNRMPPTAALPDVSEQGVVEARYYDGIDGSDVSALLAASVYPDNPTEVIQLQTLVQSEYRGNNYGALVRGYIKPPISGNYRFFIASDDQSEFLLSHSESSAEAQVIASVPAWSYQEQFDKYSSQSSGYQSLDAGQAYYFELRFKEGSGADHFRVEWEGPGFSQQVIASEFLYSYAEPVAGDGSGSVEPSIEDYQSGYRVGFLDGRQNLAFNPVYPPLDADGDGLYDNWEVVFGLDPSNPDDALEDQDGDLLSAQDEYWLGTHPGNPDTDGDGIPDGAEYAYELNPLNSADAAEDLDGDGASNLDEFLAQTDLTDAADIPSTPESIATEPGLWGQYFEGTEFTLYRYGQIDSSINYQWRTGAPDGLPKNSFSVRWSTLLIPPHEDGRAGYRIVATADDGVRVYLNGDVVINGWVDQPATTYTADVVLDAGTAYPLVMEYYESGGGATAQLVVEDQETGTELAPADIFKLPPALESNAEMDSDSDGIPDSWELAYGLNPWRVDSGNVYNNAAVTALDAYTSNLNPWTLEPVDGGTSDGEVLPPPDVSGSDTVVLKWTAPDTREDGSPLTTDEIAGYEISYSQNASAEGNILEVSGSETTAALEGLSTGDWFFKLRVIDTNGLASSWSQIVEYSL